MSTTINITVDDGGLPARNKQQVAANRQAYTQGKAAEQSADLGQTQRRLDRAASGLDPRTGKPLIPPSTASRGLSRLDQRPAANRFENLKFAWKVDFLPEPTPASNVVPNFRYNFPYEGKFNNGNVALPYALVGDFFPDDAVSGVNPITYSADEYGRYAARAFDGILGSPSTAFATNAIVLNFDNNILTEQAQTDDNFFKRYRTYKRYNSFSMQAQVYLDSPRRPSFYDPANNDSTPAYREFTTGIQVYSDFNAEYLLDIFLVLQKYSDGYQYKTSAYIIINARPQFSDAVLDHPALVNSTFNLKVLYSATGTVKVLCDGVEILAIQTGITLALFRYSTFVGVGSRIYHPQAIIVSPTGEPPTKLGATTVSFN